jgi:hypothetical protein
MSLSFGPNETMGLRHAFRIIVNFPLSYPHLDLETIVVAMNVSSSLNKAGASFSDGKEDPLEVYAVDRWGLRHPVGLTSTDEFRQDAMGKVMKSVSVVSCVPSLFRYNLTNAYHRKTPKSEKGEDGKSGFTAGKWHRVELVRRESDVEDWDVVEHQGSAVANGCSWLWSMCSKALEREARRSGTNPFGDLFQRFSSGRQ